MNIKNLSTLAGICLGIALLISLFLKLTEKDTQLEEYKKKFDTYQELVVTPALKQSEENKRQADSAKTVADLLQTKSNNQTSLINTLKTQASELSRSNKKFKDSVMNSITPQQDSVCGPFIQIVNNQELELKKKDSIITVQDDRHVTDSTQITSLNFSVSKLRHANDTLTKVIKNFPVPNSNNKILGFIPKPGPRTTFTVGVIIGLISKKVWDDEQQK